MKRNSPVVVVAALTVIVTACGGAAKPATDASKSSSTTAVSGTSSDGKNQFLASCATSPELKDYCGCAYDVTARDFPDLLKEGKAPTERVQGAKDAVGDVCAKAIPEPFVKQQFLAKCASDDASFAKYCDCSWTEYRKVYSPAQIAQDKWRDLSAGSATLKATAATCGPNLSEPQLAAAFKKECATKPELAPFCDCTWKEARKRFSVGEIVLNAISWPENQGAAIDLYAKCDKLNPDPKPATKKPN